jgi:hypothetical protein
VRNFQNEDIWNFPAAVHFAAKETAMRTIFLLMFMAIPSLLPAGEGEALTAKNLPAFLSQYGKQLDVMDAAYADLASSLTPLRDESGKPLTTESLQNRRQALTVFHETAQQLSGDPLNLVLTARMMVQMESLTDDLANLAQVCYDNGEEDLGDRLAQLHDAIEKDKHQMGNYLLKLAGDSEEHIRDLVRQNKELRRKLQSPGKPPAATP